MPQLKRVKYSDTVLVQFKRDVGPLERCLHSCGSDVVCGRVRQYATDHIGFRSGGAYYKMVASAALLESDLSRSILVACARFSQKYNILHLVIRGVT